MHPSNQKFQQALFVIGLTALVAVCFITPLADLDFLWHIRQGELYVQSGHLNATDQFTYTIGGQPIHDHEWLYEIGLYFVWNTLGFAGLKLLKALLVLAPLAVLARHLQRQGLAPWLIMAVVVIAILMVYPIWNLRPLWFTVLGLLLTATAVSDHCRGGRELPWWLPAVFLLWGNLHPGILAGQVLVLSAIIWEWANQLLKLNSPLARERLHRLMLIGGLALLASLITPDPVGRLLYPLQPELRHPIMRVFTELRPLSWFLVTAPEIVLGVWLFAVLAIGSVAIGFRTYRLWEVALLAVAFALANLVVRGVPDFVLLFMALVVPRLIKQCKDYQLRHGTALTSTPITASAGSAILPTKICLLVAGLTLVGLLITEKATGRDTPIFTLCECPVGAVNYIDKHGLEGNFFTPPNYGAYLGWRRRSSAKVFVDTRGFFFPPQVLEDSQLLPQMAQGWQPRLQRVLEDYSTDYFLLETTGPRGELWRTLKKKAVQPLYMDDHSVLLSASQLREALLSQHAHSN